MVAHGLVGLELVSELATRIHCSGGTAWARYAVAARHCGSMDGKENAGPQIWSSRTIAISSKKCEVTEINALGHWPSAAKHFGDIFILV